MAASPSSAYTRTPDAGHGPWVSGASSAGTLRTLAIRTPLTFREPTVDSAGVNVSRTVRPGATSSTVRSVLSSTDPASERRSNVIVYVKGSDPVWVTSNAAHPWFPPANPVIRTPSCSASAGPGGGEADAFGGRSPHGPSGADGPAAGSPARPVPHEVRNRAPARTAERGRTAVRMGEVDQ